MILALRALVGKNGTGYRRDPEDRRDKVAVFGVSSLPSSASLRRWIPDVLDQGPTSTCVAQTWAQMIRAAEWQAAARATGGVIPPPPPLRSRLFAYYHARAEHREQHRDSGTYLRTCAKALLRFGCPVESKWPFSTWQTLNKQPPAGAYRHAFDQRRLGAYYRIDAQGWARVDQVKAALASGYLVGFGTAIDQDFKKNDGPYSVGIPTGDFAGLHAMTLCGYDDASQTFEILNSWGTDYRDGGFVRGTYDWIAWPGAQDFWVGRLAA